MEQARSCDLVIASQTDPDWDYSLLLDFPERLAIESGRPTLIVPHAGRFPRFGQRVLVAWNGKREAARAVFDALPLLNEAEAVRVLWSIQETGRPVRVPRPEPTLPRRWPGTGSSAKRRNPSRPASRSATTF